MTEQETPYLQMIHKLEKQVPPEKLKGICVFIIKRMILRSEKWLAQEYVRYELQSKEGVSFDERMEHMDHGRIGMTERGVDYYHRVLKNFTVKEWHEFVFEGDETQIVKTGLDKFVTFHLKDIIKTPEIWTKK